MRQSTKHVLITAVIGVLAHTAQAATFNWTGTNNTTSNWSDSTKWQNMSGTGTTVPGAGDVAEFRVSVDNWTTVDITGGASVGSLFVRPRWGPYRFKTSWSGTPSLTFNNSGAESYITLSNAAGANQTTTNVDLGPDGSAMRVNLANNLTVQNDAASVCAGQVSINSKATLTGGAIGDRRVVTIKTTTLYATKIVMGGAATFVGDWVVDGAKSTLDMNTNAFGDASNSITLKNGGTLDLNNAAFDAATFAWTRSLSGAGTVVAHTASAFRIGSGAVNLTGAGASIDRLNVSGNLTLDTGSTLKVTGNLTEDSYLLISATGTRTGVFTTTDLPLGYHVVYGDPIYGANTVSIAVPEPASVVMTGLMAAAILGGRRRRVA